MNEHATGLTVPGGCEGRKSGEMFQPVMFPRLDFGVIKSSITFGKGMRPRDFGLTPPPGGAHVQADVFEIGDVILVDLNRKVCHIAFPLGTTLLHRSASTSCVVLTITSKAFLMYFSSAFG